MTSKRVVLVTGCSTGIGAHCARRLRDDGWLVFATARKDDDLARLRADGFDAVYLEQTEPASIEAAVDYVLAQTDGRLDAVFNNAGYAQPGTIEDLPIEALREQMDVNFFAYHIMVRKIVPVMRAQGFGRIVHCSSVLGRVVIPLRGAYCASKFALEGLTISLRQELDGSGVFATCIEPGPIPSSIAVNASRYAAKYIDAENSVHHALYKRRLAELASQNPPADGWGSEPVYKALDKALNAKRPKPHYAVTPQTHISFMLDRILPKDLFYRLLKTRA